METKPWYTSKTLWAAIIATLSGLVSLTGHVIDPGTQAHLVDSVTTIADAVTTISSIVAAVGRSTATTTLTLKKETP